MKKILSCVMLALILVGMLTLAFNIKSTKARTIIVPDDYPTIQQAIDAASPGDAIYVRIGTYYENVIVNKPISLIGEDRSSTIIDGGMKGSVVTITYDNVSISGFTIRNSDWTGFNSCILVDCSTGNNISHNIITTDGYGICLNFSDSNVIADNIVTLPYTGNGGILLLSSSHNILNGNIVSNGYVGIHLSGSNGNVLSNNHVYATHDEGISLVQSGDNTLTNNSIADVDLWSFGVWGNNSLAFDNHIDTSNTVDGKPIYYLTDVADLVYDNQIDASTIYLINCKNITIQDLLLRGNFFGICFWNTTRSEIENVTILENAWGIFFGSSSSNIIADNTISRNDGGIFLWRSDGNIIFHNKFIENNLIQQVYSDNSTNIWDDGYPSGGNYWSDYDGTDADCDGIGDSPYVIDSNNTDRYPLIAPIKSFDVGTWDGVSYNVDIISNSIISGFYFNPEEGAFLRFNVTGKDGTSGFCRVTIPKDLMWAEDKWIITVGGLPITNYTIIQDPVQKYTYLYFSYNHSTQTVIIRGTHVIPEFPSTIILPLILIPTMLVVIFIKNRKPFKSKITNIF